MNSFYKYLEFSPESTLSCSKALKYSTLSNFKLGKNLINMGSISSLKLMKYSVDPDRVCDSGLKNLWRGLLPSRIQYPLDVKSFSEVSIM